MFTSLEKDCMTLTPPTFTYPVGIFTWILTQAKLLLNYLGLGLTPKLDSLQTQIQMLSFAHDMLVFLI